MTDGAMDYRANAQAADSSIEYAENGTAPMGTFFAYDQDGDVIRWSLTGPDADLFTIVGGVLAFKESPNYEEPESAVVGAPLSRRNVYRVTIDASGGTHDVAVTVTDVDEPGEVIINRPQPQVDRPLEASMWDEDSGVASMRWRWARSEDGTTWTSIEGAVSPRRRPSAADVGMYLRATVTYSDKFGHGKTALAVSANRVEAKTLSNAAPTFAEQDIDESTPYIEISRSVAENTDVGMPIGEPVSASDADDDILYYELLNTPDLKDKDGDARFTIDTDSGQLRVGQVLGADSGERKDEDSTDLSGHPALPLGEDAAEAANSEYLLRVMVTDPSTATSVVNVIVTVTGVNEPPLFDEDAPTVLRVRENSDPPAITFGERGTPVDADTYAVTDQDDPVTGPRGYDDRLYAYSVSGVDSDVLALNEDGVLSFVAGHIPDFEEQNSYSVVFLARSGEGSRSLTSSLDLTIAVVDEDEAGEVFLSQREPQVGKEVHASVRDPDGGVTKTRWVWERSDEIVVDEGGIPSAECRDDPGTPTINVVGGWSVIERALSSVYTPEPGDVGRCLRVSVTYGDNIENPIGDVSDKAVEVVEAPVQDVNPANTAPRFLVESDRTSRRVAENTKAGQDIGTPVTARDDDGDLLIYTLGGTDAQSFEITRNNGQLKTKASLDYEDRRRYTVQVTATDPSGAMDSILVSISVSNTNDPAQIAGKSWVEFPENGKGKVTTFYAYDPEGSAIKWSLGGQDADLFTVQGGGLSFKSPPNYEEPQSSTAGISLGERNEYKVIIQASDGIHDVTVRVTDMDESGEVSLDRPQPQVGRPIGARLSDDDEVVVAQKWQWARSGSGRYWSDIKGANASRRTPTLADVGMYLRSTVTYTDRFGDGKSASSVSAYRVEAKTTSNAGPTFAEQDEDRSTAYIEIARSVDENSPVGSPVGDPVLASDEDEDILFYELLDTPDLKDEDGHARFTIDSITGQIRVGSKMGADAGEREDEDSSFLIGDPDLPDGEVADEPDNSKYVLQVRAVDPSTASTTANVVVTVANVNEPPQFGEEVPTELQVVENVIPPLLTLGNGDTPVDAETFVVTDQDGSVADLGGYDDTSYTYSLSGIDASTFVFDGSGTLSFRLGHEPDFEKKSSYSLTILASSGEGSRKQNASLDVIINVVDAVDLGEVSLSQRQPELGTDIHATVSDDDGGVTVTRWVWERSAEITVDDREVPSAKCREDSGSEGISIVGGWTPIGRASSAVYSPRPGDVGRCLRAVALYTDNLSTVEERATGVLEVPVRRRRSPTQSLLPSVNAAPFFPDQDFITEGEQSDRATREVAENSKAGQNIGDPVRASDADGDLLIYTLVSCIES